MKGELRLSQKEARRLYVMEQLHKGEMTVSTAAAVLSLSERQIKRLKKRFALEGAEALVHRNRGRQPSHTVAAEVRSLIVDRAICQYADTSCEHVAELLERYDHIRISGKTVVRILKEAGIPLRYHHKPARRRRSRDRMPQLGLLIQMDASQYKWLEDRGPELHLHGAIDDATGRLLGLRFDLQETMVGYLHVLRQMISRYGVPRSLYTDRRTIFFSPKTITVEDELAGLTDPITQFGFVLQDLGVTHIPANSPQAKGRIERLWGTLQSRLVVELRIAGVTTLEAANEFLATFIDQFNQRFAVEAANATPAFASAPEPQRLERILTRQRVQRSASSGSTISYLGVTYRLTSPVGVVPLRSKTKVSVHTLLDGTLLAYHNGDAYELAPYQPKRMSSSVKQPPQPVAKASPQTHSPDADHPWRVPFKKSKRPIATGPIEREIEAEISRNYWNEIFSQR